ncbi:TonB-dependent receptor [Sphingomonas sp. S-NIH.Pt15_0812]|uniref:TonB-dependent receptor n=1 Tax=Sphingomonas sp. S-NIH.Pt15_0812 TaxID=1920129 RepID=UPI000F7EF596|nr:TonB-dependent receptor [Sphingomonas sp. S-NIH.Pt15_0812]RSU45374.1 TonB-dependent receptor [Sphingomonas sp. S-NIH.Pt15_0812]
MHTGKRELVRGHAREILTGVSLLTMALVAAPALAQGTNKAGSGAPAQSESGASATGQTGTPANGSLPRDASGTVAAVPPSAASTVEQAAGPSDDVAADIVVTGLRQSVATAQALKFNSDQFVDSITATDIGKLPDKNVAEALQRVSGVQISRNYGEGSGIAIRGLTQVKTLLNGRDVFGGSGGRSLSFEDVPSELLGGVDVYKNPSAKEIEGGIGGIVNLRTRMPFDEKGFVLSTTVGANYFDLSEDARFNGSALVSKTWTDTGIGDFGVLFDVAYYESAFRRDQATIDPYVPVSGIPGYAGQTLSMPVGAGIQVTEGSRKRRGYYAAAQWEPATNLQFYGTFFQSNYDLYTPNYSSFVTNGTSPDFLNNFQPNTGGFRFEDGRFVSGGFNGFTPAYSVPPYVNTALNIQNNTQVAFSRTKTTDYAGGVKWQPTDRLHVNLDLQYERATAEVSSYTAFAQKDLAGYTIDLSGDLPAISFQSAPGTGSISDLSAYRFTAIMDHLEDSVATQKAARLDLEWDFDDSILTSVQGGIRYTDREAINRSTPYNWTGASPTNADGTPLNLANPIALGLVAPYGALFGGDGGAIVGPVPYASARLFDDAAAAFRTIGGRAITTFTPQDINTQREKTYAGYLAAYFKVDAGLPIDGNVAVRFVKTENEAAGTTRLNYRPTLDAAGQQVTLDQPYSADQSYTKVLPSINLRAHLTERLQLRIGASKGLSRPEFSQLNPNRQFSVGYVQLLDAAGNVIGYQPNGTNTGSGGNPSLKPLTVDQADLALEWNVAPTTFLYGTVFYKKLTNFTTSQVFEQQIEVPNQASQTFRYTAFVNGAKGEVKGFEIGGNTFFDFLPGPLSGFGAQANVTYVDSSAPGATGTLLNGDQVPTSLQGLSKWSYNLVGLYEKYGVTARAAFNWRSSYLFDPASNGTGGVPIYNRAYGQLDASIGYNFTPKVSVTIDAINLTKSRFDSYQYYPGNPRNFELNDRRFGISFRMRN